ncbi:aminotransferase class V-fold PLP-dependent enzyme [Streptomyces sp. NPDC089919]|uniref:aminotransferase class V-fold PLP-dependent enzyme n=1 Tax=Streptomyces sp. NPDC089919 TaxID=3155188 RepID=UPI0034136629
MQFDLATARADTPGVAHVVHLNNAGASLAPRVVTEAMTAHLTLESTVGAYEAAERAQSAVGRAHHAVARLLGARSDEIAIVDSATRAWGLALASIPLKAGDRVLVSPVEYGSNHLSLLHLAERTGVRLEFLPVDANGLVDPAALEQRLDDRVKLVAMAHVPMHDGLVNPVARVGELVRRTDALFLVDACQSVGQLPVDVREIDCDLLVGCGRKYLRGPRGTGFLYVRSAVADRLTPTVAGLDGIQWDAGGYRFAPGARRFETWEANAAARIGLGVAVDYALGWGVERTWQRIRTLAADLRADLAAMPGVTVEDRGVERCGNVAVTFDGLDPFHVRGELLRAGINTWVCLDNAACQDMRQRGLSRLLRISVHYYNSESELERLRCALDRLTTGSKATVFA